jgi:hypothetical protein
VFIEEIVPKPAIALTARWIYGENYISLPMRHEIVWNGRVTDLEYSWRQGENWSRLFARAAEAPILPAADSLEQYITEHYWGYSRQKSGSTLEYHVKHVPWSVRTASEASFAGNAAELYGNELGAVLSRKPDSAYIADGSPVEVYSGAEME